MKRILLFAAFTTGILSSCSTAFKSGQTPDDLYYSPGVNEAATAREEKKKQQDQDEYLEYVASNDDRYLHMKVANRQRWDDIDDYSYWNDSRYNFMNYNAYNGFNSIYNWNNLYNFGLFSGYNGYGYYNSLAYNPYYSGLSFGYGYGYGSLGYSSYGYGWNNPMYTLINYYNSPKYITGYTTSTSNISAYRNKTYSNQNGAYSSYRTGTISNQNSFGDLVKRVFSGSSATNNSSSFDRPARSFSSSPSTTAPSSSAGGNSGGFRSTGTTTSTGRGGKN